MAAGAIPPPLFFECRLRADWFHADLLDSVGRGHGILRETAKPKASITQLSGPSLTPTSSGPTRKEI
jgi:hypothetical protein